MAQPLLLDTDIGSDVDDALALGLVLASERELDLVSVTTVGRDPALRARMAARLLGLAGRLDVEVCVGEAAPVLRSPDRFGWFGHEGQGLPDGPDSVLSPEPAPERIVRAAREVEGLVLTAIGPLTNLARAVSLDPKLPRRVASLTVMGGHIRRVAIGDHEFAPGIDYNLCSDPEATVAVLGAGFPVTLITADVTLRTWLRPADVEKLAAAGPVARALAELVRIWDPAQRKLFTGMGARMPDDNVAFLHDPLTLLSLIDSHPLRLESLHIVPTIQDGVLRTVEVDAGGPAGVAMRVATDVDPSAAERAIVERLARL